MRGWHRPPWFFPAMILSGVVLVFVFRATMNDYILSIVCFMGINIILVVSLNLTNGFTGLFSLGHPAFMAVGGYVAAILIFPTARKAMLLPALPAWLAAQQWSLLPALILGGIFSTCTAFLIGFPSKQKRRLNNEARDFRSFYGIGPGGMLCPGIDGSRAH